MKLVFYTGPQCSLCDDAEVVLRHVGITDFEKINIRTSPDLYHLYGARIPVLKRVDTHSELGWPFDEQSVENFIK
ncbi:MAG: glutaredoxin family protein [Glaciecola sp.]